MAKKVIIIGASSGIGYSLAYEFSKAGYDVGLAARRQEKLRDLSEALPGKSVIQVMDVANFEEAQNQLETLIQKLGGLDIIIINAGISGGSRSFEWESEKQVLDINITGFAAILNTAYHFFQEKDSGHIVSISSLASLLPNPGSSAYNASKAFVSNYIQGIRAKSKHLKSDIRVTDILPGYVTTPMTRNRKGMFWVSTPEKAAQQIFHAIRKKKHRAYITRRWFLVALLLKVIPDRLMYYLY